MTKSIVVQRIYIYIYIYIYIFDKKFTNLTKLSLTVDLNFWHYLDIHSLSLVFLWLMKKKVCRTDEAAVCRNTLTVEKQKTKEKTFIMIKLMIQSKT